MNASVGLRFTSYRCVLLIDLKYTHTTLAFHITFIILLCLWLQDGELWPVADLFKAMDLEHCITGLETIPSSVHPHTDSILAMAETKSSQVSRHSDVGYINDPHNGRGPPGLTHQDLHRNCYAETHGGNGGYSAQSASLLPSADSFGALNDFHHKKPFLNDTEVIGYGLKKSDICSKDDSDECELPSNGILRTLKLCRSGN